MLSVTEQSNHFHTRPAFIISILTLALFFSGVLVFLTPLPLIYLALKQQDLRKVTTTVVVLFSVVFFFYDFGIEFVHGLYKQHPMLMWLLPVPNASLLEFFPKKTVTFFGSGYFAFYLVSAILIGRALVNPDRLFLQVFVIVSALLIVVGLVFYGVLGADVAEFFNLYRDYMGKGIAELIALQEKTGGDVVALLDLKSQLPELVDYTVYMLPSFVLASLTILFVINLVVAKRLFVSVFAALAKVDLTRYQVPFFAVWLMILLTALLLINAKILDNRLLHFLSLNLLVVLSVVYFLQGFAVTASFLEKKQVLGLWRLFFYLLLILFLQPAVLLFIIFGFFDSWLDVRKLEEPDAGTPGSGKPRAQI